MNPKFYICNHCGNIITYIKNNDVQVTCCGEKVQELTPNTKDAAAEKHLPVVSQEGNTVSVKVGDIFHPMTDEHSIQWICIQTTKGIQIKYLEPDSLPEINFMLCEDEILVSVFAYCNLHGLWKTNLK